MQTRLASEFDLLFEVVRKRKDFVLIAQAALMSLTQALRWRRPRCGEGRLELQAQPMWALS